MVIDLHIHTNRLSSDSILDPEEAIQQAKRRGLDGFCITEHDRIWPTEEIQKLREKWGFLVLGGVELETVEGHMLVFGLREDIDAFLRASELRQRVDEVDGVMIAAHPFKGFRVFGISQLKLTIEQAVKRPIFNLVDAIEVRSGRSSENENEFAQQVSERLGIGGTGGSDAHSLEEIGHCVTIFDNNISNEAELIAELKAGRFKADYFYKQEV